MELALIKLLLPILVKYLVDSGAMDVIEGEAIKDLGDFVVWVKSLRTYSTAQDFPSQDARGQL